MNEDSLKYYANGDDNPLNGKKDNAERLILNNKKQRSKACPDE
jgi:hypothetical protein